MRLIVLALSIVLLASCSSQDNALQPDPRFRTLSIELLQGLPDSEVENAIEEHVLHKIGSDWEREPQIVRALPPGVQMVYTTSWLEAEVNNGGFNQYFWNSSGELANEALAGLVMIGAADHSTLLEEAIEIRKREEQTMQELERKGTEEAFVESYKLTALNDLDQRFYGLEQDLSKLRVAYIRANPGSFVSQ